MKTADKIIMYDSPEAASIQTVTGWVSREGRFFGEDERTARYSGCTHRFCRLCEEQIVDKAYLYCKGCKELRNREIYDKLEKKPWNGEPLYSDYLDKYFFNEDILDYLSDEKCSEESLMLVFCDPQYLHEINTDVWEDVLSLEDDFADVPDDVLEALSNLNKKIRSAKPVSWIPSEIAVKLPLTYKKRTL